MALQTDTTIKIGELVIQNFSRLKIIQKIHDHHTFLLEVGQDILETKFQSIMPASQELKGQRISIEIKPIPELDDLKLITNSEDYTMQFYGIIGKLKLKKSTIDNAEEVLIITGHSESILLDNGSDANSFTKMTLADIVNKIKSGYDIDIDVRTSHKDLLAYTVQYNENAFDFINRLAMRYGEWFYSNGRTMIFGSPGSNGGQPKLVYDVNMQDFSYDMKLVPTLFKIIENDNRQGNYATDATTKYGKEADGFHQDYINKSNALFNKETVIQLNQNGVGGNGRSAAEEYTKNKMRAAVSKMMQIKVSSEVPGVTLGNLVRMMGVDKQLETSYRVTQITHTCDDSGGYKNHFTAVNFNGAVFSPKTNPDLIPHCQSQSAVVIANSDPDGLSAVMVQMPWQEAKGTTTPYIPLVQQYGGDGKGSHIIPEIGETVFVDFQGGNAEMPIVMGTFSSTKEKSGYATPNNDIKAMHTRSNNRLVMDDNLGSILMQDSSKSYIEMGNRKMELNTNELKINVQRLFINATQSTEIKTNDYILNALSRIYVYSRAMKQNIQGLMSMYSGKALINSNDTIDIEAKITKLHGREQALVHSDKEAILNSKGTAKMHADQGNSYTNTAKTVVAAPTDAIALATVYFRPVKAWKGEYGFDWLREKDNGLNTEPDYESIIEGGYKDGKSDLDKIVAYTQLKTEYEEIVIARKTPNPTASTHYYVPYLTLFSQEFVKAMPRTTAVKLENEPKYEAELRILVDIEENLEKLKFDYDDTLFEINKPILDQTTKTKGLQDAKATITIKCLKDLNSDKYIDIYAYPKASTTTDTTPEIVQRKLAGRIKVLKNDSTVRKEQKFVLVGVTTNIENNPKPDDGKFTPEEKHKLYTGLHQALMFPTIEETTLDISNNPDFQTDGKHIDDKGTIAYLSKTDKQYSNPSLYTDLQNLFLDEKNESGITNKDKYPNYFKLFKFGAASNRAGQGGAVQAVNKKNAIVFTPKLPYIGKITTLSHETLHGLGLCHTHKDSKPLHRPNYRYVYPSGLDSENCTDNIMSYSDERRSSWKWQWAIVNTNIPEK